MSGYPWQTGDELLAHDLNAAIANSIGLSSGTLPLNGSLPMTGPITLAGNATQPLHAVPLQQLTSAVAEAPFLPTAGGAMGGALSLFGNATTALHAVPLQQLNAVTGGNGPFLPLTGGTVAGATTFSAGLTGAIGSTTPNTGAFTRIWSDPTGAIRNITLPGGNDGYANSWLWSYVWWTGSSTGADPIADGSSGPHKLLFTDGASISGSNSGNVNSLYAQTLFTGNTDANNTAARNATHSHLAVYGQMGPTPTLGVPHIPAFFVAQQSILYSVAGQGGLGGWTPGNNPANGYFRGSVFGGNDNIWLANGASNYWMICGREIDTSIQGTSNVYARFGLLVAQFASTKQASGDDAAIAITVGTDSALNGNNNKNGIQFGTSWAPVQFSDSLIKIVARVYPSPATPAFVRGIDFTAATFSGNALATPGFSVDGTGHVIALLANAANDAAAATAGVPIGAMYRNANAVQVRLV